MTETPIRAVSKYDRRNGIFHNAMFRNRTFRTGVIHHAPVPLIEVLERDDEL